MKPKDALDIGVLLVEDEPFIRSTFKRMLRTLGCTEVQEAADGTEAMKLLDGKFRPELVICDVQMTPMDGLTFIRHLRAMADPELARVPVIMLTALTEKSTKERASGLAISSYLLKPVSRTELTEQINSIFRRPVAPSPR